MSLGRYKKNEEGQKLNGTHQLMFFVEISLELPWLFDPEVERGMFF
jgi:hypothetical protein